MPGFEGRVILVTGASGDLGRAVTGTFLEAGATVIGVSRSGGSTEAERSGYVSLSADLTVPAEAAAAVTAALRRTGRIDALIHLVGGFAGGTPVTRTDDATWNAMLDINLHAAFYAARAVLPELLRAGRGRLVAVGSRTALEPAAGLGAYGVSKAALVALIRTIALELARTRATANVVLPSVLDTPANRRATPGADYSRWVAPESVARLILWLASDEAADVNGAAIPIYGGA